MLSEKTCLAWSANVAAVSLMLFMTAFFWYYIIFLLTFKNATLWFMQKKIFLLNKIVKFKL